MQLNRLACAISLIAILASGGVVLAEAAQEGELKAVEQDIVLSAERQKQLETEVAAAITEQDSLSNRLIAMAETAAVQERELAAIEKRQGKLKSEMAKINLRLAAKQDVMAHVLAGLQRLENNPPPALVVAPDDVLGALRGAMIFGAIVPELRNAAQELHDQLAALKTLREKFDTAARDHAVALTGLDASRADIGKLITEKKALAATRALELDQEKLRAQALADKATSLKQLLEDLAQEKARAEAKRTADEKARAEAERKLQEKLLPPLMAFSKLRGQLGYPVEGQIIKTFGVETGLGGRLDGIVITTAVQAQVRSPVSGKIEFAGKFRSYGEMVIVNPGDGFLLLLAGLDQTQASHGQSVKAGEPVGLMGSKPGPLAVSNGLTNLTTPVLYVELRKNGKAVDSTPWWIGKTQEAMR
jgi:murein hydrolase activator